MAEEINHGEYLVENEALIQKLVNKFYQPNGKFSRDDLMQEGSMAAVKALQLYNPESSTSKVSTYVYTAVFRALRDFVKKNKNDVHYTFYQQDKDWRRFVTASDEEYDDQFQASPVALRLDAPTSSADESGDTFGMSIPSGSPPAVDELIRGEQLAILHEEIGMLPDRERDVIQSKLEGMSMEDIAKTQGCSRQRIFQISKRAMDRLSDRVKARLDNELFV